MSTFDRRSFFALAATTAAGAVRMPAWLQRAFAPQDPAPDWRVKQLRAAVATAKEQGRPLLVLVVPDAKRPNDGMSRGMWLGAWLSHATPQSLHGIALCTLACATLDELQQVTGAKRPEGDITMLLVDVATVGDAAAPAPKLTPMTVELGAIPRARMRGAPTETVDDGQKVMEAGFAKLTDALQDGLNRHSGGIVRLAADVGARLSPAQREQLRAWLAAGPAPTDDLIVRAAAEVRRAAADLATPQRKLVLDRLTQAAKGILEKDVPGATWQSDTCPSCGMAAVPPLCERFLSFYIQGK